VPHWFPEAPDDEFLSFREVCKALPVDAQRYLVRANKLGEHRLEGGLQPYVQRAGDAAPVSRSLGLSLDLGDLTLLHEQSAVIVNGEQVTLWFPREHVDSFLGWWEGMPQIIESTDPLPWESKPKTREHKGKHWRKVLREATATKGSQLTPEETLEALRAGGVEVVQTESGFKVDGAHYTAGTFRNAPGYAVKSLAKK